jgi:tryptophanyl-tRNA synthetase
MKQIALSGIKPTGTLHIGNYLGMIQPAFDLIKEFKTPFQFLLIPNPCGNR